MVDPRNDCYPIVVAVDHAGRGHVAAACGDGVHASDQQPGGSWTTSAFAQPKARREQEPQIVVDGSIEYVAYSRLAVTDGGCGDDGLRDLGVYWRQRTLPDGGWSAPHRLGIVDDRLSAFRVAGGVIHATVGNSVTANTSLLTHTDGTETRVRIPGAVGRTSLAIGSDGRARIVYETSSSLRYGVSTAAGLTTTPIPGTSGGDWQPTLALDAGDHADLLWTHSYHGRGCAGGGDDPKDGTYLATNASGAWHATRVTTATGGTSLAIDPASGRLFVLVDDNPLVYRTLAAGGAWESTPLTSASGGFAVLGVDPTTGTQLVALLGEPAPDGTGGPVEAMTRP